jgi:hypothetical protein
LSVIENPAESKIPKEMEILSKVDVSCDDEITSRNLHLALLALASKFKNAIIRPFLANARGGRRAVGKQ